MELIPAIDIIDGKCVRLAKGDFTKKIIYNENPLEVAKAFEAAGIKRLHMVDLDGAGGKSLHNIGVLENIASHTALIIDFGGGLKNSDQIQSVFNAGAAMVSVGSIVVNRPDRFAQWILDFSPSRFLPGADVLDKKIKIHGWKEETGIDIFDFIGSLIHLKIETLFCTDISKDGMLQGPSIKLYKEIIKEYPNISLIASGGISCYGDLLDLREAGCSGAIIGKAFYEGRISADQLTQFLNN